MDMNSLLSGLAQSQNNGSKKCDCDNNNNNNGILGGNPIIWIIVLLFLCGGLGGQNNGTVCGCDPKHCKELCRCGGTNNNGLFGLGGLNGACGGGSGIWLILLLIVFACGGNQKKCCTNNIINLDNCDEE